MASDYMFRGVSQTLNDPAVHAALDFSHASGAFAGAWSSNIDSDDSGPLDDEADQEIDIYLGTGIGDDWSVDATLICYLFPGSASGFDLDWNELQASMNFREYVSFFG